MDSRCGCSWSMTTHSSAGPCVSPARARATRSRRPSAPARRWHASRPSTPTSSCSISCCPISPGSTSAARSAAPGHRMPVIILSAKHDEIDVVLGLEIGADDYIAKPFRPRELLARIGAHLRRAKELRGDDKPADGRLVFRDLVIDTAERRVTRSDRDIVAHPHRVRPALVPGVERRQGALPRADPQRRLGLRAPHRDAGSSTSTCATSAARSSPTRRNRATSSPCPGIGYRFAGSDADGRSRI